MARGTFWSPSHEVAIDVATESAELLGLYREHNDDAGAGVKADATVIFAANTPVALVDEGHQWPLRRPPTVDWYDAAIDLGQRRALVAGIRHYGLLKSLVAGVSSLVLATEKRQGLHAGVMTVGGRGIAIAGGAESGKTAIFLRLLPHATEVATDDWCDLCIRIDGVQAVGLERNLSINVADLPRLLQEGLVPESVMARQAIPHGHREKVVLPLAAISGSKMRPDLRIEELFIICEVDAPRKAGRVTGHVLNELLSSISTHMPLCAPAARDLREGDQQGECRDLGVAISQPEMAEKVLADRRCFCEDLAARNGSGVELWLLPRRRDAATLAAAVDLIRGGSRV